MEKESTTGFWIKKIREEIVGKDREKILDIIKIKKLEAGKVKQESRDFDWQMGRLELCQELEKEISALEVGNGD